MSFFTAFSTVHAGYSQLRCAFQPDGEDDSGEGGNKFDGSVGGHPDLRVDTQAINLGASAEAQVKAMGGLMW